MRKVQILFPEPLLKRLRIPVFDGGRALVGPEDFRELAYAERASVATRKGRRS
jgi:hypothetical protein